MTFQQKCTNFRDFYLVKKGPKNLGIGKPPPSPISTDVFPKYLPSLQKFQKSASVCHRNAKICFAFSSAHLYLQGCQNCMLEGTQVGKRHFFLLSFRKEISLF